MSFTSFFDDPFSFIGGALAGDTTFSDPGVMSAGAGGVDPTAPPVDVSGDVMPSDMSAPPVDTGATSSGGGWGSTLLNAAGNTLKAMGSNGAQVSGLMLPKASQYRPYERMLLTSSGTPVAKSRPAPVADANQIMNQWIYRMRVFSGIYNQGRYTV